MQEFAIEIPDAEADEIKTVSQGTCNFTCGNTCSDRVYRDTAIDYIAKTPEGELLSTRACPFLLADCSSSALVCSINVHVPSSSSLIVIPFPFCRSTI